jgi:hypothetical protein
MQDFIYSAFGEPVYFSLSAGGIVLVKRGEYDGCAIDISAVYTLSLNVCLFTRHWTWCIDFRFLTIFIFRFSVCAVDQEQMCRTAVVILPFIMPPSMDTSKICTCKTHTLNP